MATKKQQQSLISTSAVSYYVVRSVQRVSLVVAALATFSIYACLAAIGLGFPFGSDEVSVRSAQDYSDSAVRTIDTLTVTAAVLALVAVILSLALLAFPRVQKYQKHLVVDGIVLAVAFFALAIVAQSVVQRLAAAVL